MMKRVFFVLALVAMVTLASRVMIEDTSFERSEDFNRDWKFSLVDDPSSLKYSEVSFDDSHWTETILPHDWSIGLAYDTTNADGATGYAPGGTGWYRKKFTKEINDDQKVYVYFDGIYNNSEVWINGEHLGFHPYGYSPFYYEITDQLNDDGTDNVITFKVDRTRYVDSRWYTGSGIYRNVDLITTHKLHIPIWGTFITTAGVSADQATVNVELTVQNDRSDEQSFDLVTEIFDANAGRVAIIKETKILSAASNLVLNHQAVLKNPKLWDLDDPNLYSAVTSIIQDDMVVDHYTIRFGIRDVRFDPDDGFFLNGENMKIKGVCLHHDGGLVGAAVPKDVWKRRLNTLKEGGTNAIRIAHNPASQELLELCDEMGILVQDEFFDEWDYPKDKRLNQQERHDDYHSRGYAEHFQEWAEKDLKSVMKAHRNNPSVFQWSIGNEIEWTYHPRYRNITGYFNMNWQGNYFWDPPPLTIEQIRERHKDIAPRKYELAKTAMKLSKWTKEMDTTRVVTANLILPSASHETGYTDALDVVGYSYRRVLYDYGHGNYPDKPIMGTENLGQWHEWKSVMERQFISGVFLWTGIDYLGESHGQWPRKAQPSGLLDVAGFPKGSYHMMKSLWVDEPHIHIATQTVDRSLFKVDEATGQPVEKDPGAWENALWAWQNVNTHWNYAEGEMVIVEVYSNLEELELFLDDRSFGKQRLDEQEDRIFKWPVPFSPGTITVNGLSDGQEIMSTLSTTEAASELDIASDRGIMTANGCDVAHIELQIRDSNGLPVQIDDRAVTFQIKGDVRLLGVDNGSASNIQPHQTNSLVTYQGRALLAIQAGYQPTTVKVRAVSDALESNEISIDIVTNNEPQGDILGMEYNR